MRKQRLIEIEYISYSTSQASDSKPYALFFTSIKVLNRHVRKGDRVKTDNVKLVLLCFSWTKSRYGIQLIFFFYPLWEMSSSTLPWQFSNGGRLDTTKCDKKRKSMTQIIFSFRICQWQYAVWLHLQWRSI